MFSKKLNSDELNDMTYTDIANYVLEKNGKKMKISDLFMEVIKLRGDDPDKVFEQRIGDFFSLISTDKRFIMLDKGYWDLRVKHKNKIVVAGDDEEDEDIDIELDDDNSDSVEEEKIDYDEAIDTDDDTDDDDLSDLVVIDTDDDNAEE